jgi:hypothetical protein
MRSIKDINKKDRELFRENSVFYQTISNIIRDSVYEPVDKVVNEIDIYLRQTPSVMNHYITTTNDTINVLIQPINNLQIINVGIVISNNAFF